MNSAPQILNFGEDKTGLEGLLSGFVNKRKEIQETDAIKDIYGEYQKQGGGIEKFLEMLNTDHRVGPSKKVELANQALEVHKTNQELYKQQATKTAAMEKEKAKVQAEIDKENRNKQEKINEENKKNQAELATLDSALERVEEMKNIRKKGRLGFSSHTRGLFGGETAKDRGAYETLGNSLISYATSIPIRNRVEFEKLAARIADPDITDAEAAGILQSLDKIIKDSKKPYQINNQQPTQNFVQMKDAEGNIYDIPPELVEQARSQGLK